MHFRPHPSPDRWRALGAVLGAVLLGVLLLRIATTRQVDGLSFVLALLPLAALPAIAYLAYRTLGVFTMEYWVDRDAVTFVWGPTQHVVPMREIRRIQRGAKTESVHGKSWLHWPCEHCRQVIGKNVGRVHCYATRPLDEQIILVTDTDSYGLSPSDPQGFLQELQKRYALGVARPRSVEVRRPPVWRWPLWRDWTALLLIAAGLLGVLAMFGMLTFRFPELSSDLPLHFDVNGLPDRIAPKSGLFALPLIGLLAWLANLTAGVWIYRRLQRYGAYLLWGGAVVVQVIATMALANVMRW